jgi:uncharacterized membrane-anchored protein YhcB (DUF1043 family)
MLTLCIGFTVGLIVGYLGTRLLSAIAAVQNEEKRRRGRFGL